MYISDNPIESAKEDIFYRNSFVEKLFESIINWKDKRSIVIALYGKWGSGKTSIINLLKEKISTYKERYKPTLLEFNPWLYSDIENLSSHFFSEIAKELRMKSEAKIDREIAEKLELFLKILEFSPKYENIEKTIKIFLTLFGLFGFSILLFQNNPIFQFIFLVLSISSLLIGWIQDWLKKAIEILNINENVQKSLIQVKNEIIDTIKDRKSKLLVVIDDIDRLSSNNLKEIFQLIKLNADFPNTIYLLSFDREIVENMLEKEKILNGKDFLSKIV